MHIEGSIVQTAAEANPSAVGPVGHRWFMPFDSLIIIVFGTYVKQCWLGDHKVEGLIPPEFTRGFLPLAS